jgi:hypothetical protein
MGADTSQTTLMGYRQYTERVLCEDRGAVFQMAFAVVLYRGAIQGCATVKVR